MTLLQTTALYDLQACFQVIQELRAKHASERIPLHEYFHTLKARKVSSLVAGSSYPVLGCFLDELTLNTTKMFERPITKALNPDTAPEVLTQLSETKEYRIVLALVRNPSTPAEVLTRFSTTWEPDITLAVAQHLNTPLETLERLSEHDYIEVRKRVALNPNTTVDILIRLCETFDLGIGSSSATTIAQNPNAPLDVLVHIARMKGKAMNYTKKFLIDNPSLPLDILDELMFDEDVMVREYARERRVNKAIISGDYVGYPREWVEGALLSAKERHG